MEQFETPYIAITDAIASHAKWRTGRTALLCGEQQLTWREFNQAIDRVANGLIKSGLRKGDKVSVLMLNSIEMLEIMMGTIKAGGVIVPLSVMLTAESLANAYYVVVKGTRHFNYSDFSLFSPEYQKTGILGPIEGERMERIISDYVLAFFDKYLKGKGKDTPLLRGPSTSYPEVEFNWHKAK